METLRAAFPILLGYLLGSLPFGYLVVRLVRRIDIRDYGSHNIGATNVLRVVGPIPALVTLLGDIGKGFLPVLLATMPPFAPGSAAIPGVVVGAGLAAIAGHAYSLWFYVRERRFSRGKSVATGLGVIAGLVAGGQVAGWVLPAVLGVWLATLGIPRLVQGRWGFVSLSSVLAALSLPILFVLAAANPIYVSLGVAVAIFVVWKHKENLGRLMDGTEPRLGEKLPLPGQDDDEVACAFFIHPMSEWDKWQPGRFAWVRPFADHELMTTSLAQHLPLYVRPMKVDEIRGIETRDGRRARVYLIAVPWMPAQIKENPRLAVRRAVQAARLAKELGATVFGLGAYWSVVGNKGEEVQAQADIPITNGGALTAGSVSVAVPAILKRLAARGVEPSRARAAVVGANGVVGFGICRRIAGEVGSLVMVGRDAERLDRSVQLLQRRYPSLEIVATTEMAALRECDLIFSATSEPNPVILPEHVRHGTLLYDLGRPADVHPSVRAIPGVEVVPGGTVRPPGRITMRIDLAFGSGQLPACLAETIIIALERAYERTSIGDGTKSENIDFFIRKAEELGFTVVDSGADEARERGGETDGPLPGARGREGDGSTTDPGVTAPAPASGALR